MTNTLVVEGEGRWLIVSNTTIEPISVPHPDRDAKDNDHLSLSGFEETNIGEEWLESPTLIRDVERGRLSLSRSDTLPTNEFSIGKIVSELTAKGWAPHAAVSAWQICAQQPIPEELDHLIDLEPSVDSKAQHGPTFINARWDLLRNQLPWLREILELERRWRKRGRIIGRLNARIAELEALPRV